MDCVAPWNAPLVCFLLVHKGVVALEVRRVLQQCIIFSLNELPRYLLLDDCLAPIIVKPWLGDLFPIRRCLQERILLASYIKVDLEIDNVVVEGTHCRITDGGTVAFLLRLPETALKVTRCGEPDFNRAVEMEHVVKLRQISQ